MASHDIGWVPGACMHFRSLDFVINAEGDLERAPAPTSSPPATSFDMAIEALGSL